MDDPECLSKTCRVLLYIPIGTLAIICNIVVLIGMLGSRLWSRNQHLLIINLCVCDLLSTTWWTVGSVALYNPTAPDVYYDEVYFCLKINIYWIYLMFQMSIVLTIVTMAIDHYVAIVLPLRYEVILSRRRIVACMVTPWVIPIIINFMMLVITLVGSNSRYGMLFNLCDDTLFLLRMQVSVVCLSILILAAIIIMLYVYIRVLIEIRRSAVLMRNMIGQSQSHDHRKNHHAVVTTLLVLVTFIIGWVPYITTQYINFGFYILEIMPIVNTLCDPLIYAIRLTKVQQSIKKVFSRLKCNACKLVFGQRHNSVTGMQPETAIKPENAIQQTSI